MPTPFGLIHLYLWRQGHSRKNGRVNKGIGGGKQDATWGGNLWHQRRSATALIVIQSVTEAALRGDIQVVELAQRQMLWQMYGRKVVKLGMAGGHGSFE